MKIYRLNNHFHELEQYLFRDIFDQNYSFFRLTCLQIQIFFKNQ
jgi:hypothetical protein